MSGTRCSWAPRSGRGCVPHLLALDDRPELLRPGAVVIAQLDPREDEDLVLSHLARQDARTYGRVRLAFYRRIG